MLACMRGGDTRADTPLVDWSELGVSELPTGTVTLLLADVEGSTQLWQTQPEQMTAAVALLDRTLTDVVAAHGGVRPAEEAIAYAQRGRGERKRPASGWASLTPAER